MSQWNCHPGECHVECGRRWWWWWCGFGKRDDRRPKINICLNCGHTNSWEECPPPPDEVAEGGRIRVATSSLASVKGGTHVDGYEARSHTFVPSVARPLSAASIA
jgi:hypothetical protein